MSVTSDARIAEVILRLYLQGRQRINCHEVAQDLGDISLARFVGRRVAAWGYQHRQTWRGGRTRRTLKIDYQAAVSIALRHCHDEELCRKVLSLHT